jgi:hypothetical protein
MIAQRALFDACRTLFGDEVNLGPEFLAYLQPSGAKVAFRVQAKQHHPDYFHAAPPEVRARQTARFREIHQAYNLLREFLENRRPLIFRTATTPRPAKPARGKPKSATTTSSYPSLPPLQLEFGLFAFYCGKITYAQLIDALLWQRRQRPAIGAIAQKWGWLSADMVGKILADRGHGGRFGRKAVALGLLSPLQVDALLRHQRNCQQRLGQYFVARGLMTTFETDRLARDLERHNLRFLDRRR